jgi:hypothetical protein
VLAHLLVTLTARQLAIAILWALGVLDDQEQEQSAEAEVWNPHQARRFFCFRSP